MLNPINHLIIKEEEIEKQEINIYLQHWFNPGFANIFGAFSLCQGRSTGGTGGTSSS